MNIFNAEIKKIRELDRLSLFLCMVWGRELLSYANAVFLRLPLLKEVGGYATEIILVIALLYCFRSFSKYIKIGDVLFYFIWLTIYILTYVIFPQNSRYLDGTFGEFFLYTLPFIFVGRAIKIDRLSEPFYIISLVYIIWRVVVIILLKRTEREMGDFSDYNMSAAYTLLPHLLMVTWHLMNKKNVVDIIVCIAGIVLLLGFGTRGPILCLIIFVALYYLLTFEFKKKLLSTILIIIFASLAFVYVNMVFETLSTTTQSIGLSTRIYNKYEEDMLDSDSGRDLIHNTVFDATREGGFFGLGICGDRVATRGFYSHNLFVEVISSFGYTLGSLLIFLLVLLFFITWRCCNTVEQKGFFLVLLSFNAHLLLSSSFLQTPLLFFFIGYCVRLISDRNILRKVNGKYNYV